MHHQKMYTDLLKMIESRMCGRKRNRFDIVPVKVCTWPRCLCHNLIFLMDLPPSDLFAAYECELLAGTWNYLPSVQLDTARSVIRP